ncbi:hypothetical protein FJZ33_08080 [Candidatus Poribacteria bacterium]|nr:hypothetical protein [Candidatus Poribacteria bacterium]
MEYTTDVGNEEFSWKSQIKLTKAGELLIKKIKTQDFEERLNDTLTKDEEALQPFEYRHEAGIIHPESKNPGIYILIENNQCLYIGNAGERGGYGISQRLKDLFTNSHTLSYSNKHGTRHNVSRKRLLKCRVQWCIEKNPKTRSLLEHYFIARLRPVHFNGDGCGTK